jgi:hypothetical protein
MNCEWECFVDEAYYSMWAVRPVGERRWGHCFHVLSREEAEGLRDVLNGAEGMEAATACGLIGRSGFMVFAVGDDGAENEVNHFTPTGR